ncbi:MAG: hypothetical protein GWO22_41455, partial [Actinobacteria bacterium]|nr:hypothetical protein [Actinomycetota bacterium]NIV59429.1 hypothetical protein [Actinomycetota bacterium]NIW33708.1 hypothetical protein [Actinomycetota bacterium]
MPTRASRLATLALAKPFAAASTIALATHLTLATPGAAQSLDQLVQDLEWRNIGPANMAGRVTDIEAVEADFATVYVAAASGGVWKSTNAGTT